MREFIAVDAGGTSTRAVLVDEEGRCRGYGRGSSGNPTSAGPDLAASSVGTAIAQALDGPDVSPSAAEVVLVAHAGGHPRYVAGIEERLVPLGVHARVMRKGDLLALFASGTPELEGAALIAGTGAIGGAMRDGEIARLVDGTGWLLGDAGSGFWIGHRVARAVVDDLDSGRPTRLTAALLERMEIEDDRDRGLVDGRPGAMGPLIARLYEWRPVELSVLAPLAFELAADDEVAGEIVREAVAALTALLRRVRHAQPDGPLVIGGSVLVEGVLHLDQALQAPLLEAAGDAAPVPVADGLVGAAVLALRTGGVPVDAPLFAALTASIRKAAAAWRPPA